MAADGRKQFWPTLRKHGSMEEPQLVAASSRTTRPLVRETTIEEYKKNAKSSRR
jgi:hypothetical protein